MDGYLKLPDVSASRIEDGWYKTGDLMRRDSEGFYFFVGRADDMFVCGGENVFPGEVEALLERHPQVHESAVVAVDDEIKGQIPVAFVVRASDTLDEDALRKFAIENGPAYQHPRQVFFLDALPLAGTNKVDRRLLTERAAALRPGR
jgi:acyl-CoA synthetase (AMP-forming)/AMP-acid ligase II